MICPNCGGAVLEHDTRDVPYTYKGATTTLAGIEGYYCAICGESIHGAEIGGKLSRMALAFNSRCSLPRDIDALTRLLDQDGGDAARSHLAAGFPIYYREGSTPSGACVKEFPDGHRELVRFNPESGEETVLSRLADTLDRFGAPTLAQRNEQDRGLESD